MGPSSVKTKKKQSKVPKHVTKCKPTRGNVIRRKEPRSRLSDTQSKGMRSIPPKHVTKCKPAKGNVIRRKEPRSRLSDTQSKGMHAIPNPRHAVSHPVRHRNSRQIPPQMWSTQQEW